MGTLRAVVVVAVWAGAGDARSLQRPKSPAGAHHDGDEDSSGVGRTLASLSGLVPRLAYDISNPTTMVRIRKHFHPFMTQVSVGGDYDPRHNLWTFRSDWVDTIVGGTLALQGSSLRWTKMVLPGFYDVATRVKVTAAVDIRTAETESNVEVALRRGPVTRRGLQLEKEFPIDGADGHFKVGVAGALEFPDVIGVSGDPSSGLNVSEVQITLVLDRVDLLVDF